MCYDVTSAASFENVRDWKKEIENNADNEVLIYLVGNRCDLDDEREITAEDGVQLAHELSLDHHIETSAKTGHNIGYLFETLTKHLYLVNNGKLGEFRNDEGDQNYEARTSSVGMKKNVDLYKP